LFLNEVRDTRFEVHDFLLVTIAILDEVAKFIRFVNRSLSKLGGKLIEVSKLFAIEFADERGGV
jgi:hypothetical protein